MGTGLAVRHCSALHRPPITDRPHEERLMSTRGSRKSRVVTTHPRFEPSRVAAACLVDAYACLVPLRRRTVRTALPPQTTPAASPLHQEGRVVR